MVATDSATRRGSPVSSGCGLPVPIWQKSQRRVHWSPPIRNVASRSSQHSKMFGQPASSHTVCRPSRRTRFFSSVYSGPVRSRVLIQGGFFSIGTWLLRASSRSIRRPSGATTTQPAYVPRVPAPPPRWHLRHVALPACPSPSAYGETAPRSGATSAGRLGLAIPGDGNAVSAGNLYPDLTRANADQAINQSEMRPFLVAHKRRAFNDRRDAAFVAVRMRNYRHHLHGHGEHRLNVICTVEQGQPVRADPMAHRFDGARIGNVTNPVEVAQCCGGHGKDLPGITG